MFFFFTYGLDTLTCYLCALTKNCPGVGKVASALKLCNSLVYALNYKPCISVITYLAAPSQAPGNIEWNLANSKIFLNWEHVKAMENESEVTGYKVSLSELYQKVQNWGNK